MTPISADDIHTDEDDTKYLDKAEKEKNGKITAATFDDATYAWLTHQATEMVKYSNANILSQAGQSILTQANQSNQGVFSILG